MSFKNNTPSFIVLLILTQFSYSFSNGLDISDTDPSSVRSTLKPIISIIAVEQETPLPLLSFTEEPIVLIGCKFFSIASTNGLSTDIGFPTFWSGIAISPNFSLGGQIGIAKWKGDNINTTGFSFTLSSGEVDKKNLFSVSISHLYGPDDFHLRNLNATLGRYYKFSKWNLSFAYTAHFFQCKIHVTDNEDQDQNYKKIEKMKINHLRSGIYRDITKNINLGLELDASRTVLMIAFSIIGYL